MFVDVAVSLRRWPVSLSGEVYDHVSGSLSELDRQVVRHVPPGGNWRDLPDDFASRRIAQIRRSAAAGEGSRSTYYGRLSRDRPSYTISTYFSRPGNGCFIHPEAPRLISVREAARLQGFPDSYRFTGRGRSRFVQVGNAVPPLLAFQLARALGREGRFVDLFSGAGGLSLGFEWAGNKLIAAVDNDPACINSLVQNGVASARVLRRDLSASGTIQTVLREIIELNGGQQVDILVGGPPCQGFSTAGSNRADDPRNRLVGSFLRAVEVLRPKAVVMENVPALTFQGHRVALEAIITTLQSYGYTVDMAILHAEAYGLPQLRRRLFIQAIRDGVPQWPAPHRRLISPHQISLQPGASLAQQADPSPTVGEALDDLPQNTSEEPDLSVQYAAAPLTPFQRWARGVLSIDDLLPAATIVSAEAPSELAA